MPRLEELTPGVQVKVILPGGPVTVISAKWHGSNALELTYKDSEASLEIVEPGRQWSFTADGNLFRLVSEALRIKLAYLFDPLLAVNTSDIEPLLHQITAVYEKMILRQPLRFLLADAIAAGKTIMAGLLIKELFLRGDLRRCMVVSPGNLVEQWQDELDSKFVLPFEILAFDSECKLQRCFLVFLAQSYVRLAELGHPAQVIRSILRWNSRGFHKICFKGLCFFRYDNLHLRLSSLLSKITGTMLLLLQQLRSNIEETIRKSLAKYCYVVQMQQTR